MAWNCLKLAANRAAADPRKKAGVRPSDSGDGVVFTSCPREAAARGLSGAAAKVGAKLTVAGDATVGFGSNVLCLSMLKEKIYIYFFT